MKIKRLFSEVLSLLHLAFIFTQLWEACVRLREAFRCRAAGSDTELNSSMNLCVRMVLITIITSTSHKAITTLHLLHSAHWSPAFSAELRPEKNEEMCVGRFGNSNISITIQELPSLERLKEYKYCGGWWEIYSGIVCPFKDAKFLIVCDKATSGVSLAPSIHQQQQWESNAQGCFKPSGVFKTPACLSRAAVKVPHKSVLCNACIV